MIMNIKNKKGSLLILTYMVVFILISLGAVFSIFSLGESKSVERDRRTTVAFNMAEAGIERALYAIRKDYLADFSWGSVNVSGSSCYTPSPCTPASSPSWTTLYSSISPTGFSDRSYTAYIQAVAGQTDQLWVKAVGTYGDQTQTIVVYAKMTNASPWNNAIFAGAGASGQMVNGNVTINGSVHILGSGLGVNDLAVDLGGTAELVGNNYNGIDPTLLAKVPALPITTVNGIQVQTLNAELRVKHGKVGLSGSSTVGQPNDNTNRTKELIDGAYVSDGWAGTQMSSGVPTHVYSDNGYSNAYDLGNQVSFPSLNCGGTYCDGYYSSSSGFNNDAVIINGNLTITPTTNYSVPSVNGNSFSVVNGQININGKVYIKGSLSMSKAGSNKTVTYEGAGAILASGNVQIDVNLVTNGGNVSTDSNLVTTGTPSYPTKVIGGVTKPNIMAIMTPGSVGFNEANINVMGLFYGETSIISQKQTNVMGTFVSNYFDMGTNVPKIYQVPQVVNYLPGGLIGGTTGWIMSVVSWQKN